MSGNALDVSVVVPVWNEDWATLAQLVRRTDRVLCQAGLRYEIILVDNGSAQAWWERLTEDGHGPAAWRLVRLRCNVGQECAIVLGAHLSKGRVVVTLNSDLQDPPETIPALLREVTAGADVVLGVRLQRGRRPWLRRAGSWGYNRLMSWRWGYACGDWGCGMTAIRWSLTEEIYALDSLRKSLKVLALDRARVPPVFVRLTEAGTHTGVSRYTLWQCCAMAWRHLIGSPLGWPKWREVILTDQRQAIPQAVAGQGFRTFTT